MLCQRNQNDPVNLPVTEPCGPALLCAPSLTAVGVG